jgi:hypothetical protein
MVQYGNGRTVHLNRNALCERCFLGHHGRLVFCSPSELEHRLFDIPGVRPLLGKRFAEVMQSPEDFAKVPDFSLCLWVGNVLYVASVASMKLSIVALYWKLFGVNRTSKLPLIAMACIIVMWFIGAVSHSHYDHSVKLICCQTVTVIFACTPIAGSWDLILSLTAKCIDKKKFYMGASIPNVITDVVLVAMPLPYVWKLHAPIAQRIVLAGIFALGAFVSIVSIIRLSVLVKTTSGVMDLTYTFKDVYLWSLVEIQVGLICVCLPSLRPMVRVMGLNSLFSFSSRSRPSGATPDPYRGLSNGRSGQSGSRIKGNSFFGTSDGTRVGDEDEFEMIGKQERMEAKGATWTGQTTRVSCDTDNASHDSATSRLPQHTGNGQGITVQREWDVSRSTER